MQFHSYAFLLIALPGVTLGFFLLSRMGRRAGQLFLILASLSMYAQGDVRGIPVLLLSIAGNALLCRVMLRREKLRRAALVSGLVLHIGMLLVYKYLGFGTEIWNRLLGGELQPPEMYLPLGVSFFTFQQISYLLDTYHGKTRDNTPLEFLLYSTYFPKLLMGPIVRQEQLLHQFRQPETYIWNPENGIQGIRRFTLGLFKKCILADTFSAAAAFVFRDTASSMELLLAVLAYTFQIYFDFSGYTDMAAGFSRMLNIRLPQNFDSPYKAMSMRDFWKRWHMSLTRFFTDYLYIPLGGSRKGTLWLWCNTLLVFALSGLWHGAGGGFILWGVLNGLLSLSDRYTEKYRMDIHPAMQWMLTFAVVNVLWLLFQTGSVEQWLRVLVRIVSLGDTSISDGFLQVFAKPELEVLFGLPLLHRLRDMTRGLYMLLTYGAAFWICLGCENTDRRTDSVSVPGAIGTALLLAYCLTCLQTDSIFVYNNF